jgi:hypothetical protein
MFNEKWSKKPEEIKERSVKIFPQKLSSNYVTKLYSDNNENIHQEENLNFYNEKKVK